ncbi:hypothetical protein BT93_G1222 [Corymbia citriodora subsp. variegata]|nr:hypothetical protein BT93_G1222 [Corymbia citriodora subsp. variegata]
MEPKRTSSIARNLTNPPVHKFNLRAIYAQRRADTAKEGPEQIREEGRGGEAKPRTLAREPYRDRDRESRGRVPEIREQQRTRSSTLRGGAPRSDRAGGGGGRGRRRRMAALRGSRKP